MFVNANKEIVSYEDLGINIKDITLLSVEEHNKYADIIPSVNFLWWLRSPYCTQNHAIGVFSDGGPFNLSVNFSYVCVRPALICTPTGFTPGTKLRMLDLQWTVLNESLILCDESVGRSAFRVDFEASDASDYNTSDVKKFVDKWAREVCMITETRNENMLEKVITATEICLSGGLPDRCRKCPYSGNGCSLERMRDTITLLKQFKTNENSERNQPNGTYC